MKVLWCVVMCLGSAACASDPDDGWPLGPECGQGTTRCAPEDSGLWDADAGGVDAEVGEDAAADVRADVGEEVGGDVGADVGLMGCPLPRITSTPAEVFAGDLVDFSGADSSDQDGGRIVSYEWALISSPMSAGVRFEVDPNDAARSRLRTEAPGVYVVELQVVDDDGTPGCEPARAEVDVMAEPGDRSASVRLTWVAPSDPDPTDASSPDLDLHYLLPMGTWGEAPGDIYWENRAHDIGAPGAGDDPGMTQDSTSSAAAEIVDHPSPPVGLYVVGVYYAKDMGFGQAYASVEIDVNGVTVSSFEDQPLLEEGVFWEVATITWPGGQVRPVGSVTAGFPR